MDVRLQDVPFGLCALIVICASIEVLGKAWFVSCECGSPAIIVLPNERCKKMMEMIHTRGCGEVLKVHHLPTYMDLQIELLAR
jgi:hypothetical protein